MSAAPYKVKTIGAKGELSFGKAYAGQTVKIEQREAGVWLIRVIPENEKWLHTPQAQAKLRAACEWADNHPARATTPEEFEALRAKSEALP